MALWGNNDATSNSCLFVAGGFNKAPNTANRDAMYQNTTVGSFISNLAVGQFGVDVHEKANTAHEGTKAAHAGWQLRRQGSGPLLSVVLTANGTGYSNTNLINVVAGPGGANGSGTITTNGSGVITAISITSNGSGYIAVNPTVSITNATGGSTGVGTGATLVATAGGRAGRVHYECLVAMGSLGADSSTDDTVVGS